MRAPTLLAAVVVLAWAAAAAGAAEVRVIRGDASAGPVRIARSTLPQVRAALSATPSATRRRDGTCTAAWRGLGLTVDFVVLGTDPRNPCVGGFAAQATIARRDGWRTALGLRVGDGVGRLRRLYPRARFHAAAPDRGYWLVARRACAEVGGGPYPGLLARTAAGRVTRLELRAGICE
jgi:hypothetical protein